jgi:ABC-type amino acid transport substrate-binding protein
MKYSSMDSTRALSLSRRTLVRAALPVLLGLSGLASAEAQERSAMEKIRERGMLKVALYKDNAPYSDGKAENMVGLDASLAKALADRLGLRVAFLPFDAGENMSDDLRNMVWKGHYLGYGPADVMLHVPVDKYFMEDNRQAFIFSPYSREHLVVLHDPHKLPQVATPEDLTEQRVAAEQGTGAASALLGYRGGLLRDRVALYKDGIDAARAVVAGKVDAAFVSLAQAEAAVFDAQQSRKDWAFSQLTVPGVPPNGWALGMAVKSDNKELAKQLDDALEALRTSGELLAIFQAHGMTLAAP